MRSLETFDYNHIYLKVIQMIVCDQLKKLYLKWCLENYILLSQAQI